MSARQGRIGPYRILAKLERGGMSEVHLVAAEDQLGSLPVRALKVMPKELLEEPTLTEMFLDEARLAIRLSHPNVVQTTDVGEADGCLYLAMELLEGETVHRLVQRTHELAEEVPLRVAITIVVGVLQGLHYVHNLADRDGRPLQVVHRDITPSNLYVTTAGTVKVCDFGIAKTQVQNAVTVVGMRKGKLGYLAPEQLTGATPDARADIYGAGVVLWELVAGKRLFRRGREIDAKAPRLDAKALGVPPALADACVRALEPDRRDRYPTALAMWTDLDAALRDLGGPLPAVELGQWVERLVGEDVQNLRRLTANALRDSRVAGVQEGWSPPPEATSYTVRPPGGSASTGRAAKAALVAAAMSIAALVFTVSTRDASESRSGATSASAPGDPPAHPLPPKSTLRIEPWPESATVALDGARLSRPFEIDVDSRVAHRVEVGAPGYLPRTFDIDVPHDLLIQANLVEEAPRPAALPAPAPSQQQPGQPQQPSGQSQSSRRLSSGALGTALPPTGPAAPTPPRPPTVHPASPRDVRQLDMSDPW